MFPNIRKFRSAFAGAALALGATCTAPAHAQSFSAVVSPPRFESSAKPGETYRDVFEIANVDPKSTALTVRTADWHLDASGAAIFDDALVADSCRPWVAIERRELTVSGGGKYRFRFEVAVPKDTAARECRFALMIEGAAQDVDANGLKLPISGRIGVIVYLAIGEVASALTLDGYGSQNVNGTKLPTLKISNHGNAHGRLDGFVEGKDAEGHTFNLVPATLPILPGEAREIALTFNEVAATKKAPAPHYPLTLHGNVYDGRKALLVDTVFSP